MKWFRHRPITVNINLADAEPTIFEQQLIYQQDRKIASIQLNGEDARLSAFVKNNDKNFVFWQMEDAQGNKMAGLMSDLDTGIEIIKGQLGNKDFQ